MADKFSALRARKSFLDFAHRDQPRCPHCGDTFDAYANEAWQLYDSDGGVHQVSCPSCDLDFQVTSHARWSFSTDDQEDFDPSEDEGAALAAVRGQK